MEPKFHNSHGIEDHKAKQETDEKNFGIGKYVYVKVHTWWRYLQYLSVCAFTPCQEKRE